jgi:hypothetical protein
MRNSRTETLLTECATVWTFLRWAVKRNNRGESELIMTACRKGKQNYLAVLKGPLCWRGKNWGESILVWGKSGTTDTQLAKTPSLRCSLWPLRRGERKNPLALSPSFQQSNIGSYFIIQTTRLCVSKLWAGPNQTTPAERLYINFFPLVGFSFSCGSVSTAGCAPRAQALGAKGTRCWGKFGWIGRW